MPADEHRVFVALGALENEIKSLRKEFYELREKSTEEHRKVHDIVVATSESIRVIARKVDVMEPHVEAYKLKAKEIDDAVELAEDYQEERAEKRGADRFKAWLYGIWAGFGALLVFLLGKLWDALPFTATRPHP